MTGLEGGNQSFSKAYSTQASGLSLDMYTEAAQTTGQHRFLQHSNTPTPCSCPHRRRGGGLGSARRTDHPSPDCRRDIQAPGAKDVGGRALGVDGVGRRGHRSPQRRPVFAGPGPCSQSGDPSQACPWELNPAQWSCPLEPGVRHYQSVREQCGCVARSDAGAQPFNALIPHPLPHLQVKGQGYWHRRTISYVTVDEEEEQRCGCASEDCHLGSRGPRLPMPNGRCGARPAVCEGGGETAKHPDWGRRTGVAEEGCNGSAFPHKCFFPTEVPQRNLKRSRQKGPGLLPSSNTGSETSKSTTSGEHQVAKQERSQDSVRDQIRQVVTDLEDVLGGLKQVHVEMKEVVEQIDRLTANVDLSKEAASVALGSSGDLRGSAHSENLRVAPPPNRKAAANHTDEDRIILRTNSPSPVHIASVVKTSRFTPPARGRDASHEKASANGHLPHMCPPRDSNHTGQAHAEPRPQSLDPKVIIGNSTSCSRTQKPPLYPQNGRCGKGSYPQPKPVRTPAKTGGGCHSTSMV